MSNLRRLRSIVPLLGLALIITAAYSQETASIVGTVTDQTSATVPNAKVSITNTDTGLVRVTETNSTGAYAAPQLAIGHYNV